MSTIFVDRDGVINENRSDYVKNWQEFRFLPGSKEAINQLTRAGHRIIVCTNQSAIARGIVSVEIVEEIHQRMRAEVAQVGGLIEKIYYCPHSRDENCCCRKPRPGMLLRARDDLGIDMKDAIFIGDSIGDVRAGMAAGVHPVLVLTGLGSDQLREHSHEAEGPFHIAMNLKHVAEHILQCDRRGLPLALAIEGANRHDSKRLFPTLDALGLDRPEPTVMNPQNLCLDAAYDYDPIYGELYERGFEPHVRLNPQYHKWYQPPEENANPLEPGKTPRRWVVERLFSWLNRWRCILIRWEKLGNLSSFFATGLWAHLLSVHFSFLIGFRISSK